MKTREIYARLGGAPTFERLINSKLGQRLARQAEAEATKQDQASASARMPAPHMEVMQRRLASALHDEVINNHTPALTKYDAARVAVDFAQACPRDFGLRRVALHLHKSWESDQQGSLTLADIEKVRAFFTREYPRSRVAELFDDQFSRVSYKAVLDTRKLTRLAGSIDDQAGYERVIEANGLGGQDAMSVRARAFIRSMVERRFADKGEGEAYFHPDVEGQSDDAVNLPEEDAKLKAKGRRRGQMMQQPQVVAGDPDEELGEQVETLVNKHMTENAPEELDEGHKPWAQAPQQPSMIVSPEKIEAAILDGREVKIAGYSLRIASRKGSDQVEMTHAHEPAMAWPIRKMTAAISYYARVVEGQVEGEFACAWCGSHANDEAEAPCGECGDRVCTKCLRAGGLCQSCEYKHEASRRAQSLEAPKVNEQQDDWVNIPSKSPLGKGDSSAEDISSIEPGSIDIEHPGDAQSGSSNSPTDLGGDNDSESKGIPIPKAPKADHPADAQSGTSFCDTNLGPERSGEEPAALAPKVNPPRSADLREAIRAALKSNR